MVEIFAILIASAGVERRKTQGTEVKICKKKLTLVLFLDLTLKWLSLLFS